MFRTVFQIQSYADIFPIIIVSASNVKGILNSDFPYYIGNYGFWSDDSAIEYIGKEQIDCFFSSVRLLGQCAIRDYYDVHVNVAFGYVFFPYYFYAKLLM